MLVLGYSSKFFPIHKEILGFLKRRLELFEYQRRLYFQILPNLLKSWEIVIFEVPLIFCQIVRIDFQAWYVCRRPNLWLKYQINSVLGNKKIQLICSTYVLIMYSLRAFKCCLPLAFGAINSILLTNEPPNNNCISIPNLIPGASFSVMKGTWKRGPGTLETRD